MRLLRRKDRNRRQYTKGIGREENNLRGVPRLRYRLDNILNMVDWVRYTGILRYALIAKVDLAVGIYGYILE